MDLLPVVRGSSWMTTVAERFARHSPVRVEMVRVVGVVRGLLDMTLDRYGQGHSQQCKIN